MGRIKDITGKRYGLLVAQNIVGRDKHDNILWLCKCDCGIEVNVCCASLEKGNTKSCGCIHRMFLEKLHKDINIKHNRSHTRLYNIWRGMKQRCYVENSIFYKNYGGRGITVCDEWLNKKDGFANFYKWAINNGYKDELTLDRKNNNGNYEPLNCRWTTNIIQSNNKRNNVTITYKNETRSIAEWSRLYDLPYYIIWARFKRGWTANDIFTKPIGRNNKNGK